MTCQELLSSLEKIEQNTRMPGAESTEHITQGIWTIEQKGNVRWYQTDVIFVGGATAQPIELVFDRSVQINRIEQEFNAVNARDSIITTSTPPYAVATTLSSSLANTSTDIFLQLGIEYKYSSSTKLIVSYNNSTALDTARIRVSVDLI